MDGFHILLARKNAGVSQDALAPELGLVARSTLTDIENNRVDTTDPWIIKAIVAIDTIKSRADRRSE